MFKPWQRYIKIARREKKDNTGSNLRMIIDSLLGKTHMCMDIHTTEDNGNTFLIHYNSNFKILHLQKNVSQKQNWKQCIFRNTNAEIIQQQ